ncbi:MAG TPA: histidine kinase [Gemmatimonas sp.]|nr:histidine kinase [Gemmatimonas sp.]
MNADVDSPLGARRARVHAGGLPAIAGVLSRTEWSVIAGAVLLLAAIAVDGDVAAHREAGQTIGYGMAMVGALVRTAIWIAMAPSIFRALDSSPVEGAHRVRSLAFRVVLAVGVTAAHHGLSRLLAVVAGPAFGNPPAGFAAQWPEVNTILGGSFDGFLYLLAAHIIAQRVHRTRVQQQRQAELETSLARAQLHALTQELRPHFLFNALNGIVALVREEPARAESMLIRLSEMLRRTLETPRHGEVMLAEELEHLELYLSLERMRFGARLEVTHAIAPETLPLMVPAMLLQPLVENALAHGIGPMPGPGEIVLEAARVGDRLRILVRDTGAGLPADVASRESTGVGNTRARLAALHGTNFRFELGAPPVGTGTLVTIELPVRTAAAL